MCERFKHFGEKDWKSATMLIHFSFLKGRNKREKYKLCKLTYLSNRALWTKHSLMDYSKVCN